MTTNTTNTQAEEILAKQVAEWRKEVARLNDLIAHAEGRDSQAASIADDIEFWNLIEAYTAARGPATKENLALCAYIDTKLAQAREDGKASVADVEQAFRHVRSEQARKREDELYAWQERAQKAESRLAEIQRGVEVTPELLRHLQLHTELGAHACADLAGGYSLITEIIEAAVKFRQPTIDTSGLPG